MTLSALAERPSMSIQDPPRIAKPVSKPRHIRRQEAAARQRLLRLEAQTKAREYARAVMAGIAETVDLAEARGETVEHLASGAVRVDNRDPLLRLLRAGHLTPEQYDAGREVVAMYEARVEGVGSTLGSEGGSAHDNDRFTFNALQRAKKLQRLGNLERAILVGVYRTSDGAARQVEGWGVMFMGVERSEPVVALGMLRAVCAEGKSLSSQGEGRAFDRNATALQRALDVAKEVR